MVLIFILVNLNVIFYEVFMM